MAEKGIHYLARASIRKRLEANALELEEATNQLQEAIKMGDLSENSEYDAAKDVRTRIRREREQLLPVLTMPVVQANDNISVFEEGCVVELKVYETSDVPWDVGDVTLQARITEESPQFRGKIMLGGDLPIMNLLQDAALSVETPVGKFLMGKPSGLYSIPVPGGFVLVDAKKLLSTEFTPDEIGCEFHGQG